RFRRQTYSLLLAALLGVSARESSLAFSSLRQDEFGELPLDYLAPKWQCGSPPPTRRSIFGTMGTADRRRLFQHSMQRRTRNWLHEDFRPVITEGTILMRKCGWLSVRRSDEATWSGFPRRAKMSEKPNEDRYYAREYSDFMVLDSIRMSQKLKK